uniref:Uncharacterized protein n=1 Tax=Plectus sambesii TaxID=2011161 RepID=A0A914XMZ8_9BILA
MLAYGRRRNRRRDERTQRHADVPLENAALSHSPHWRGALNGRLTVDNTRPCAWTWLDAGPNRLARWTGTISDRRLMIAEANAGGRKRGGRLLTAGRLAGRLIAPFAAWPEDRKPTDGSRLGAAESTGRQSSSYRATNKRRRGASLPPLERDRRSGVGGSDGQRRCAQDGRVQNAGQTAAANTVRVGSGPGTVRPKNVGFGDAERD